MLIWILFFFSLEILLSKLLFFIFYLVSPLLKNLPPSGTKNLYPTSSVFLFGNHLFFSYILFSVFCNSPSKQNVIRSLFNPVFTHFFAHPAPCSEMPPSLTTTMARRGCSWPCVHACSSQHLKKPPPSPHHSSKMSPALPGWYENSALKITKKTIPKWDLQICHSSIEITSVMNGSHICERWMEWSELYQRIEKISNFGLNT